MRRTIVLAVIWVVVAVGAVTVAWQGVAVVGNQVTDDRPAPLAANDIERQLSEAATTTPGSTGDPSTTSSPSTAPGPVTPPGSVDVSGPGDPVAGPGPQPTATPTEVPPSPPPPAPAETRTYNLQGGTASLRFAAEGVTVVFANPAPGFAVSVEPEHGNGVKVEFESASHESRVDGWWENGPVDRVREEADD